jgi:D-mannose binding lectin/S-locus glycoprotein domain/PAN-like domain
MKKSTFDFVNCALASSERNIYIQNTVYQLYSHLFAYLPNDSPPNLIGITLMRKFLLFLLLILHLNSSLAVDLFKQHQNITDGEKLESANGNFVLGFFATGASTKHYFLGIWFKVSPQAIIWVANRDSPLMNSSGVLSISNTGNLILVANSSGSVMWSSNSTYTTNPTSAQLLDTGNLVLRDLETNGVLWQSFDWPTNTFLPGMRVGKNLKTGHEWSLFSWRSSDDPAIGEFSYIIDTRGSPELFMWNGGKRRYRTGPWNGLRFSGIPEMTTFQDMFGFSFTNNQEEISYGFYNKPGSLLSRVMLNETGNMQRLVWDQNAGSWSVFWSAPRDQCDYYSKCGVFGLCNANDAMVCSCFHGFEPRSPNGWYMRDTSQGCVRRTELACANGGDGFNLVQGVKLPSTYNAAVDMTIDLDQCREKCLANCSCVAYSGADIRNGGSGCIIWVDKLIDTRFIDGGQDLYIKVARSDLGMFYFYFYDAVGEWPTIIYFLIFPLQFFIVQIDCSYNFRMLIRNILTKDSSCISLLLGKSKYNQSIFFLACAKVKSSMNY